MTAEAPKPAPAPKRPKPIDADEPGAKSTPPARAGFLPTGLSRAIVLAAFVLSGSALVATLVPHRYAVVVVPKSDNALVYRLDSLTGRLSLCSATQCQPVAEK